MFINSKKPEAKKFRKWAGNILDDIIFNESNELKRQLEEQEKVYKLELLEKDKCLLEKQQELYNLQKLKAKKYYKLQKGHVIYAVRVGNYVKPGKTKDIKDRESHYVNNQQDIMFHVRLCYDCDLAEKVIHHIYREQKNKEWFDISNDLAIYTIDMVCDFLDRIN